MIKTIAKVLLPASIRERLREMHRRRALDKAVVRLAGLDLRTTSVPDDVLLRAGYGWDNEGWSAGAELLVEIVRALRSTEGPVLECGSGLSTVLLGVALKSMCPGREIWSLEHAPSWAHRVEAALARYTRHLTPARIVRCPLKDYGEFSWYDPPLDELPRNLGLVVCDGPPGDTPGGRVGMLPVLGGHLRGGCVIFLDDTQRDSERAILERWAKQLGVEPQLAGADQSIGIIVKPRNGVTQSA